MKIYQRKFKDCNDSFWYDGLIATNGKYSLVAIGDIRILLDDGQVYHDQQAVDEIIDRYGMNDKCLFRIKEWLNNNWFEVYSEDTEGEVLDNYDQAIQFLGSLN